MSGTWYIQRALSDPLGPFTTEEILDGLAQGEIPTDSLVREIAGTAWLPFAAVPDFAAAVALLGGRADHDETRLAPKAGPAWRSAADRHVVHGAPVEAAAPSKAAAPRPTRTAPAPITAPSPSSVIVASLVAALGIVWCFVRLGALLSPPAGWIAIVDRFHMVRDGSIADLALALVAYPLLFVALAGARARAAFGIPLVRAVSRVLCVGELAITFTTLVRLQRSPRLGEVSSTTALIAVVAGAPLILAACAASLAWLFPAPAREDGPSSALLTIGTAGAAVAALAALFSFDVDVVTVAAAGERFVYTDTIGLRLYAEGRREGVGGTFKIDDSRGRGFFLDRPTRGRFVQDFPLAVASGDAEIGREVELLDGPGKGLHVYVLPEDARVLPAAP